MHSNRGQTLHLFAFLAPVLLAFVGGFVIDGGLFLTHVRRLQEDLDAACLAAAQVVQFDDYDLVYSAFSESLAENDVAPEYFQPRTEDARGFVRKGIQWGPRDTLLTGLAGPHQLYFGSFFGWDEMPMQVRSRCRYPLTRLLPVAMQEPWFEDSALNGTSYPILGQGVEATIYSGKKYRGAITPSIICQDVECETMHVFEPLVDEPPDDGKIKSLWTDVVERKYGTPFINVGDYIPTYPGTDSGKFVQPVQDMGVSLEDHLAILVFDDGEIFNAKHGWETVRIIGYAIVEVTGMDSNTIEAAVISGGDLIEDPLEIFELIRPRTVPWDWFRLGH